MNTFFNDCVCGNTTSSNAVLTQGIAQLITIRNSPGFVTFTITDGDDVEVFVKIEVIYPHPVRIPPNRPLQSRLLQCKGHPEPPPTRCVRGRLCGLLILLGVTQVYRRLSLPSQLNFFNCILPRKRIYLPFKAHTMWMTVILFCRGRNTKKYDASTGRCSQLKEKSLKIQCQFVEAMMKYSEK